MSLGTTIWSTKNGRALWNNRPLTDWVPELTSHIVATIHPIEIWLFGSVARGDDNPDSDIDLLLVVEHDQRSLALELDHEIRRTTNVPAPFDLAFSDLASMTQRRDIAGTIERAAQTEGRLVYQRD